MEVDHGYEQFYRDAAERARVRKTMAEHFKWQHVKEWAVGATDDGRVYLEAATFTDDVRLYLNGNWTKETQLKAAHEICAQLNAAEAAHDET